VVGSVASGCGGSNGTNDYAKLVGQWTRTIAKSDVDRAHALSFLARSMCTLTIKASHAAHLDCTSVGEFDGKFVPAAANRVHINLGDAAPNVYTWRVSGDELTLTKLNDPTPDRIAAIQGIWRQK
jgi:hypothetical protein